MKWATEYIAKLQAGETVQFSPRGSSMTPRIQSEQLVTVEPIKDPAALQLGDVVLCTVNGSQYLHLIKAKRAQQFLIGNNRGGINGWTSSIHGRVIAVSA
jgi:hypothetical protein